MRMQRPTLYLLGVLGLLFCLQLTACGSQGIPGSQGKDGKSQSAQMAGPFSSSSQSTTDYAVPPVILHNPAPGGLEVVFNVNMGGYGADREQTTIGLSFLSHEKVVQLAGHEQLMCNGRDMPVHQQYALFQLADGPTSTLEGKTINCIYSVSNVSTTFSFTVPRAPVIRSPQNGAQVSRSAHTVVTYDYNAQAGKLLGIVALGPGAKTFTDYVDPSMQVTLDTSAFPTGAGSLSLSQALAVSVTQTGSLFQSLTAEGMADALVTVTWV
jgi:hypothetical protein